jgi:soluble lytic murein transglycosylase
VAPAPVTTAVGAGDAVRRPTVASGFRFAPAGLAALVSACVGSGPPGAGPAPRPREPIVAVAIPVGDAGTDGASVAVPDDGSPPIAVVLDDPRLSAVRERQMAHDDPGASAAMTQIMGSGPPTGVDACAWWYVLGRLHLAANEASEAAVAFAQARGSEGDAGTLCPLAAYADLRRSQAFLRTGDYDAAESAASAAGLEIAARDEARLALAESFAARGSRAGAVPLWREWLAVPSHGPAPGHPATPRWVDVSLRLADALLDGVDGIAKDRAQEALDLTTHVVVASPISVEKTQVTALRARAAVVSGKPPALLTPLERASQARAWLDASKPERARDTAVALLKAIAPGDKKDGDAACKAAIVAAQASPRGKSDVTADAWGAAVSRCEGEDDLVTALYGAAKASAAAKRYDEAIARFARVERLFPQHRLADDARLRAALAAEDEGDASRSETLLASLVDAYPDGDMRSEALLRVGLSKLVAHDFAAAASAFDRAVAIAHDDRAQGVGGRAAYFRARTADLAGALDDAKDRYAALVGSEPLSYYMLLAYARLRVLDDGRARTARESAEARELPGPLVGPNHAELALPAFDRFRRLLEVGEIDAARREVGAAGLVGEGTDAEVIWAIASLYDRAGACDVAHSFARGRLVDYRSHWPSGRWRRAWEIAFPRVWEPAVARESAAAQIGPSLVWAVMREESAFNPEAKSAASAFGLMQLVVPTARLAAKGTPIVVDEDALKTPDVSIALGSRVLSSLRKTFPGHPAAAIAGYNAGSRAVRRWMTDRPNDDLDLFVDRIPYDETRAYVKRVVSSAAAYAYLYAPDSLDELLTLPDAAVAAAMR